MFSSKLLVVAALAIVGQQSVFAAEIQARQVTTIMPTGTNSARCTPWPTPPAPAASPVRCVALYWVGSHKPSPEDCGKCEACVVDNEWVGYCRSIGYIKK